MKDLAVAPDVELEALLGRVADEFTERLHRGEQPDIEEYARRHPDLADVIRQVLAALQALDPADADPVSTGGGPGGAPVVGCLGDFRIIRQLGRGGMGVVYEAVQISLGRRVALKVLPFAAAMDSRQLQRFKNEAQAAAGLQHQNIVPVYGVGCERGVHYYAMQLIEGQTLATMIAELRHGAGREERGASGEDGRSKGEDRGWRIDGPGSSLRAGRFDPQPTGPYAPEAVSVDETSGSAELPGAARAPRNRQSTVEERGLRGGSTDTAAAPRSSTLDPRSSALNPRSPFFRTVAQLGSQAAAGLEHAHQLGVIHRDIKPANLMVDTRGNVWLTDFGLAHCQSQAGLTMTGDLVGTLRYMSPEQALAKRVAVDHRTDIYSLGATLYELLTLEPAFPGRDRQELLRQIAFEDPRPPRRLNRAVPAELETIVLKAMEKNPGERYATAQELGSDLERFLKDEPLRARRPTPWQKLKKWARRNRAVVRAAAVMLVLALAALALSTALVWRANRDLNAALRNEQYTSYLQRIALAEREWSGNNLRRAEELLDQCPENLRGWEWHYLKRLRRGSVPPLRHDASLWWLAVSPQGDRLAASDIEGGVTVWDARTYERLSRFQAHKGIARSVVFSPDGRRLASAGEDGRAIIWELAAGERTARKLFDLDCRQEVFFVSFSPDGRRLASYASDSKAPRGEIRAWAMDAGRLLLAWEAGAHWGQVVYSPDGQRLACAADDNPDVTIWDAATGQLVRSIRGTSKPMWCVAFSPDGRLLAVGSGAHGYRENGEVKILDARTGNEVHTLRGHIEMLNCVAFSPDGRRVVSAGLDQTLKVWDVQTGREACNLRGHWGVVSAVAFGPDGRLFSAADDSTVRVWDGRPWDEREGGQEFLTLAGHGDGVNGVAFSPNGRQLASADCEGVVKLWTPWTRQEPRTLRAGNRPVYGVAFGPDGRLLATVGEDLVKTWQVPTGQELREFPLGNGGAVLAVAVSPDGRYLAAGGWRPDANVSVWNVHTGEEIHNLIPQNTATNALAFTQDGRHLALAGEDGTVRVWDVAAENAARAAVGAGAVGLAAAGGAGLLGRVVTAGRTVGEPPRRLQPTQKGRVRGVAFSRDGRLLASGGWDHTVRVWETSTWSQLHLFPDRTGSVECVAFSPDNRHLAWGGTDSTVKIADVVTREIQTLHGHKSWVRSVAFSPDGQHVASASQDGTVKVWAVPSPPQPPEAGSDKAESRGGGSKASPQTARLRSRDNPGSKEPAHVLPP